MIPKLKLFLLLFFGLLRFISCIDYEEVQIEDAHETRYSFFFKSNLSRLKTFRSRILMVDGNVWLHAGRDRNITFKTNGAGKIYVDDTDVSRLPDVVSFLVL
ncbi:hypothetical protein CRE_27137 [Caenorhabditis remanei]|uniref:Uncharacterized protein n=1 Tax=Caenorhabditis remanei TaxID=31234 RepID=E3LNM5_CAERE|nr:hypothetical protein CRE_27137 [Caenorhabditis remanei]